jgi:predicted protein tyrosine phosphatase
MDRPHILFVCGRNQWRSPTAERIYRNDPRIEVRSAGVGKNSRHVISAGDLSWADLVMVMEHEHKSRIVESFRDHPRLPRFVCLNIPDDYGLMDEELIRMLRDGVEFHLKQEFDMPI